MKLTYEIGDEAWIFLHNHKGKKTKSTVVHKFMMYGMMQYVCEIPTYVDPILVVRDMWTMAGSEDENIGLWEVVW